MKWPILIFLSSASLAVAVSTAWTWPTIIGYTLSALLCVFSLICIHVWSLEPATRLPLKAVIALYLEHMICQIIGSFNLWRLNASCRHVNQSQITTLHRLLALGKTTLYGRDHNMEDIKSITDFRSLLKLTTYVDYQPYVDRCLAGERNVLFKEKVTYYGATSGTTTAKSKLYPTNNSVAIWGALKILFMCLATAFKAIPRFGKLKFQPAFWIPGRTQDVGNGVLKGSISTNFLRYRPYYCSPPEAYTIRNEQNGQYVHLVFALREREVSTIHGMTSSVLLAILTQVENNWQKIVHDIRTGILDSELDIPPEVRSALNKKLTPDPARADQLEAIFTSGVKNMVTKIWPDLSSIVSLCTGTFALQARIVQERYLGYDIPIFCLGHMATEGVYGLALFDQGFYKEGGREMRDDFVIIPTLNFYEFIPSEHMEEEQPETCLAHEVIVGASYELVITSSRGLYRYRTGDMIEIAGHRGTAPTYYMRQRTGDVLNAHLEKVPESVFRDAVELATQSWATNVQLMNFAGCESVIVDKLRNKITENMYYVIFVELNTDDSLSTANSKSLDDALRDTSDTYRAYRNKGTLSMAEVIQVHPGTFELIRNVAAEKNKLLYPLQYKHPRIVRNEDRLNILMNNKL